MVDSKPFHRNTQLTQVAPSPHILQATIVNTNPFDCPKFEHCLSNKFVSVISTWSEEIAKFQLDLQKALFGRLM